MTDDYVKKILTIKKLGETLRELGIIDDWRLIDNINSNPIRFFGLYVCKEYVERYAANNWFPEDTE